MVLNIIKYGDYDFGKLKNKNIDVKKENPFLQQMISDMFETLEYHKNGVGLAAPQIGKNLNLFIINIPNFKEVFINPEIQLTGLSIQGREGCLSFPNIETPVSRRERVKIKYYNRDWVLIMREFDQFLSIIIQHEYDHLIGKLILD
jgi:peptide deformylase